MHRRGHAGSLSAVGSAPKEKGLRAGSRWLLGVFCVRVEAEEVGITVRQALIGGLLAGRRVVGGLRGLEKGYGPEKTEKAS